MKTVGNLLTILFTIFLPVVAILSMGIPPVAQFVLVAVYTYCLYKMLKIYLLSKILIWNGYCYWYLKRLLNQKEFRIVVYYLRDQDFFRLGDIISKKKKKKVLQTLPESDRERIAAQQKKRSHHLTMSDHRSLVG